MRFSMILGGSGGAMFTLMFWAVARQFVHATHAVVILSFLAIGICLSCGLIIGSIFKLTLVCGGPDKGAAVGVAKGFVGLGSGVYATIFQALRTADETALDFIPVLSFFFLVCVVAPAYLLLLPKEQFKPESLKIQTTPLHFHTLYLSMFVLASVIVGSSIYDILDANNGDLATGMGAKYSRNYRKVCMLLLIWLGPIWSLLILPKRVELETTCNDEQTLLIEPPAAEKTDFVTRYQKSIPCSDVVTSQKRPELNLQEMLQTPSAWLMLWTTIILVGSGTYKTNNMGEMVESLGFPKALNPATLAIFSVSQCIGRVVTGILSEAALKYPIALYGTRGVPRPFFLVISSAIAFVSHLMLAYATSQSAFVVSCTFSGLAFGMAWPLMVLIVGDVFGLKHHGANYMLFDGTTKAVGTIVVSEYIAGVVYEAHIDASVDDITCYGAACFRETHLAVAALGLTGVLTSFALMYTTRHAYYHDRSSSVLR